MKYNNSDEYKEYKRLYHQIKYHNDIEYKNKILQQKKQYYLKKKMQKLIDLNKVNEDLLILML